MEYLNSCVFQVCYVYLVLNKTVVLPWIAQIKEVLWKCCTFLKSLKVCCYILSKCMLHYCKNMSSNTGFEDICSCNNVVVPLQKNGEGYIIAARIYCMHMKWVTISYTFSFALKSWLQFTLYLQVLLKVVVHVCDSDAFSLICF